MAGEWLEGLDDANRGAIVAKGYDKLEPGAAVVAALNDAALYRNQLTIPSDEIARIPKDPTAPEWAALYERLGKPKEATAYDFADVKRGGQPLPEEDVAFLQQTAHELNLPVSAAKALAQKIASQTDAAQSRANAQREATVAAEMTKLDGLWGGQKEANHHLANEAMTALKLPAQVAEVFKQSSDAMEVMRNLGVRLREANYVGGNPGGGTNPGSMTQPQAQARIEELKRDTAWIARWQNGGADEVRMLSDLHRVAIGGPQR